MKEYIYPVEDYLNDKSKIFVGYIRKQPELIRCKDCKYFDKGMNESESWSVCTAHINRYFETCEENYCSWSERKSDDH